MMEAYTPKTIEELRQALADAPEGGRVLAGGTDLVIQMRMGALHPSCLIWPGGIPALKEISRQGDVLRIGAAVTMRELSAYLAENDPPALRALRHAACDVGSPQVRGKATIGGNIANASPAGDLLPVLFLLDAAVVLLSAEGERTLPIREFVLGPSKTALRPREAIVRFELPLRRWSGYSSAFVKLGYRSKVTVSRIGLGVIAKLDGGKMEQPIVIAGAISLTPVRLEDAEASISGLPPSGEAAKLLGDCLSARILAITPEKFDRDYKVAAAKGVAEDVLERLRP